MCLGVAALDHHPLHPICQKGAYSVGELPVYTNHILRPGDGYMHETGHHWLRWWLVIYLTSGILTQTSRILAQTSLRTGSIMTITSRYALSNTRQPSPVPNQTPALTWFSQINCHESAHHIRNDWATTLLWYTICSTEILEIYLPSQESI